MEADIHYPSDSALVGDGVRVVSRLLRRAKAALGVAAAGGLGGAFRSRVRTVRKLSQQLHRIARRKGGEGRATLKAAYAKLIAVAQLTAAQGERVQGALRRSAEAKAQRLAARLGEFLPRLRRGIDQASRRVLTGEAVPAPEELLSIVEPHTQIVPRFKAGKAVELGRELRLDEVEGRIITGYAIVDKGAGRTRRT